MRISFRSRQRYLLTAVLLASAGSAFAASPAASPATSASAGAAPSASAPTTASSAAREADAKAKLAAVRTEIAQIATAQQATAARQHSIDAALAAQAQQLDAAARAVHDTDAAIAAKTAALADLQRQHAAIEAKLDTQRAALAELLRAVYMLDRGSGLALLLGDDDIAKIDRALAYSRYFQRDREQRIHSLLGAVAQLDKLKASIEADTAALEQQRAQRAAQTQQLEQAREAQQKLLAEADAQFAQQKDKLAALQHDADALDQLLKQLRNVFADIPAQVGRITPFAQLHGRLPQPVAGAVRKATGALSQGLVIAARPGAEVHAVAYGRVAWADFMRGYGMLVIIDHGGGWMSLYGGNEAALVGAGDWVQPGQAIATVAHNSEQGGAWFGIRKDGQPVDPEGWLAPGK
jgi:murein hydrolase activator